MKPSLMCYDKNCFGQEEAIRLKVILKTSMHLTDFFQRYDDRCTKHYDLVLVLITLFFIIGHRVTRKTELLWSVCPKLLNWPGDNMVPCWNIQAHQVMVLFNETFNFKFFKGEKLWSAIYAGKPGMLVCAQMFWLTLTFVQDHSDFK